MNLALWLKKQRLQAPTRCRPSIPSPMATATAMYHSGLKPAEGHQPSDGRPRARARKSTSCEARSARRRLHKAFLRYHDPNNWPLLRDALKAMGRADLIGNGKYHLIPSFQPATDGGYQSARRKNSTAAGVKTSPVTKGRILTQHTGLPPRETGAAPAPAPARDASRAERGRWR